MPKISRNISTRKNFQNKFGFLRSAVIVLSFISLISRIIYCTFATWLTITTFDCIPCPSTSSSLNTSSDLFNSQHSSVSFKTIRALNVKSGIRSRPKRSEDLNDSFESVDSYSKIEKPFKRLKFGSSAKRNPTTPVPQTTTRKLIDNLFPKKSETNVFIEEDSENTTDSLSFKFFGDESEPSVVSNDSSNHNQTDGLDFEQFTYIPSDELLVLLNNETHPKANSFNDSSDPFANNTGILSLEELSNKTDPKSQQKDQQSVNGNGLSGSTKTTMNVCSIDCTQFLSIELSDPEVRKWATVVITGVLYLYTFVMFCIFVSSCLALVDLLVLSTFIEGAKLFAGFILLIIDSFNGKKIHFDLIDVKFDVNGSGNGWTADFAYSEYILDIIIFFLSVVLCVRVFNCLGTKPKKVSSVEELVDTRGTYRTNPSRNSLEPIYEHH